MTKNVNFIPKLNSVVQRIVEIEAYVFVFVVFLSVLDENDWFCSLQCKTCHVIYCMCNYLSFVCIFFLAQIQ